MRNRNISCTYRIIVSKRYEINTERSTQKCIKKWKQNIAITTTACPACKQINKKRTNYEFFFLYTDPAQCNEKSLMKLSDVPAKILKP